MSYTYAIDVSVLVINLKHAIGHLNVVTVRVIIILSFVPIRKS